MVKTLTVDELIAQLSKYPQDTKVFMSSDTEGNGYGSVNTYVDYMPEDKTIILFPAQERLDVDEICPKWCEANG